MYTLTQTPAHISTYTTQQKIINGDLRQKTWQVYCFEINKCLKVRFERGFLSERKGKVV